MSTIDLLVLGILMRGARNAYELVRYIREHQVDRVVKISEPAIFKACRRLAEKGYVDGETVRESGVPDKVVYAINDLGRARFMELMEHFASSYKPFYLEINTVLWNIDGLPKKAARQILTAMQRQLHMAYSAVQGHEAEVADQVPFGPRQIIKQYRMTFATLVQWVDEMVLEFEAR